MNALLVKKMLIAFLVAFGGVFIPAVLNILDDLHNGVGSSWGTAFWLSLVSGAVAAGVRAVLALSPINLVPSDSGHSLTGKPN
jgi:hypothetical protein